MKTIKLIITFFFLATILNGQTDSLIVFEAKWKKGETRLFNIDKVFTQNRNGKDTIKRISNYNIKIKVIKKSKNGFTLEMQSQNPAFSNFKIPAEFLSVFSKYKDLKIIYKTNSNGRFEEIVNWKEIKDVMMELLDKLPPMFANKSVDVTQSVKNLKDLFGSKEAINAIFFKEIGLLHYPMGNSFNIYDTVNYSAELPTIFEGQTISGDGKFYFQNVDKKNGVCDFVNMVNLDSLTSKEFITDFIKKLASGIRFQDTVKMKSRYEQINKELSNFTLEVIDKRFFKYKYLEGWPIEIQSTRTSKVCTNNESAITTDSIIIKEIL